MRPLFVCQVLDPKRKGTLLWKAWWHYGDRYGEHMWLWRPVCWARRRHEDDSYGDCVVCGERMR